ncbi:MAG TPA: hypothetical protein VFZ59_04655 [Verrucomicrobiae bacterium]|nr:hypothetical protein [Verrucomicrobiae bacterium]
MKEYILKPIMTPATLNRTADFDKPAVAAVRPRNLPPRQPLPTAVIDPTKPMLKLGMDVHLAGRALCHACPWVRWGAAPGLSRRSLGAGGSPLSNKYDMLGGSF